jgi:hypothetical protein
MRRFRQFSPRITLSLALVALALAAALVVDASGPNQAAHHALVRALAAGTAEIDPTETIDASYVDGRYYAAKAPGLAMFTLPWYLTLRASGLQDDSMAMENGYLVRLWELNLWGAVLPLLVLVLLMVVAAERLAPGYGLPAAVLLACGTLLLPFSTMFFDHLLAATIGFAAFVVLMRERAGPSRLLLVAAAGLLAGLAVVVEFPLAIVGLVLAGYAAARAGRLRRFGTYTAGFVLGILPLLAYNAWAFGSPFRLSYTNALLAPAVGSGAPLVGANDDGFYGVGLPDPRAALSLLLSEKGMVLVAPLAIVALLGLPLLWRAGRRAETMVCGGIAASFLAYNAAYYLPWGGQAPGPRFLVPALPFLAVPLALALRARPLTVAGIGTVSVAVTALATLTDPLTGEDQGLGAWWSLLQASEFVDTVATKLGLDSDWGAVVPFVAALAIACALALASLPLRGRWRADGPLLAGAIGAWALVVAVSPNLLPANENHGSLAGAVAVVVLVSLIAVALWLTARYGPVALLPAVPALFLAAPVFDERPRLALVAVAGGAVVAMAVWAVRRGAWRPVAAAVDLSTIGTTASAAGESLASVLPDNPLGEVVPGDPAT